MPAPAYCPHCFYALDADAVTCPRCGQSVGNTDAARPTLTSAMTGNSATTPGQEEPHPDPAATAVYAVYTPPTFRSDPAAANGPAAADAPGGPNSLANAADLLPERPVDSSAAGNLNGDAPLTSLPVRPVLSDTAAQPLDEPAAGADAAPDSAVAAIVPSAALPVPAPVVEPPAMPDLPLPAPPEMVVTPVPVDAPLPVWTSAPAPPPVVAAPATGTAPAPSTTAGALVLLPGEEVITQLGALYLTNKRVILYAPSILRAAFLRDVDAVGTLTERATGWSLFFALLFLGLAAVSAFVMLTQNQVAFSVGSAIQLPMWLLALGFAAVGGVLLGTYFFWVKKSLFLSVGGRPLIVISLSGWSPKRLEGVDTFVNTFSQAKDAAEYPQDNR